jgi:hypothetical protein
MLYEHNVKNNNSSIFFLVLFIPFIFGCIEKTTYSGKIISKEDLNIKSLNQQQLLIELGEPSYIDRQLNKYFYFTEKRKSKNFYDKEIIYSYLFVFEFDNNNSIINLETINLLSQKNHKYKKERTESAIIERGILEKVFGGIGPNQLSNSP